MLLLSLRPAVDGSTTVLFGLLDCLAQAVLHRDTVPVFISACVRLSVRLTLEEQAP